MKTIKELVPTPSSAVWTMINGLRNQSKRSDFRIDMNVYGDVSNTTGLCFGCAATCAVQEAARVNFTADDIKGFESRAATIDVYTGDIIAFEMVINDLRLGNVGFFLSYYGVKNVSRIVHELGAHSLPMLTSSMWRHNLPDYEKLAEGLEKLGL